MNRNNNAAMQTANQSSIIGCSLPFKLFKGSEGDEACAALLESGGSTLEKLLENIRRAGAASIEFRSVSAGADPLQVLAAFRQCRQAGLSVSIHATTPEDLRRAENFFRPYEELFGEEWQQRFTLTMHALGSKETSCAVLARLAAIAREKSYPVQLLLENSRRKEPGDAGNSCEAVLGILAQAGEPDLGVCWDFGHSYYNLTHYGGKPDDVPADEFLRKVCHTHIHAVHEGRTHFPLGAGDLPLKRYCAALKTARYGGVYNLELGFARFFGEMDPYRELIKSVRLLKEALQDA